MFLVSTKVRLTIALLNQEHDFISVAVCATLGDVIKARFSLKIISSSPFLPSPNPLRSSPGMQCEFPNPPQQQHQTLESEVWRSWLGSAAQVGNLLPLKNQQTILSCTCQTIPTPFTQSKLWRLVRFKLLMFQLHPGILSFPQIEITQR